MRFERAERAEETDKVSLISVSFLPPLVWIFDSLSVLNHFTQQRILLMRSAPSLTLMVTLPIYD